MPAATPAERAKMDEVSARVTTLLTDALARAEERAGGFWATNADISVRGALRLQKEEVERWKTEKRVWAERGHRDDGARYTAADFLKLGDGLVRDIKDVAAEVVDRSLLAGLSFTITETVRTVETATRTAVTPETWSTKSKVVGAVAGVLLALGVVGYTIRSFR